MTGNSRHLPIIVLLLFVTACRTQTNRVADDDEIANPPRELVWSSTVRELNDICVVGGELWAVGHQGAVLYSADVGKTWVRQSSPTDRDLYSIHCNSDGKRMWVVGDEGVMLHSADGGRQWQHQDSGESDRLSQIYGHSDGLHLWLLKPGTPGAILHSGDGGKHWSTQFKDTRSLFAIHVRSDGQTLWAVGSSGILHSTDGGGHWTPLKTPSDLALTAIHGLADGRGLWIGDAAGVLFFSPDAGASWQKKHRMGNAPAEADMPVSITSTTDGKRIWVAARDHNGLHYSPDSGHTWSFLDSPIGSSLTSLATSEGVLWAVGLSAILHSPSPGSPLLAPAKYPGIPYDVEAVYVNPDSRRLWTVGRDGGILHSGDGGLTWILQRPPDSRIDSFFRIHGLNDGLHLWAFGRAETLSTVDGGASWSLFPHPSELLIGVLPMENQPHVWSIANAGKAILYSKDGGLHWERRLERSEVDLATICATTEGSTLWAFPRDSDPSYARKRALFSSDSGQTWSAADDRSFQSYDYRVRCSTSDGIALDRSGRLLLREFGDLSLSLDGGRHWIRQPKHTFDLRARSAVSVSGRIWVTGARRVASASPRGTHYPQVLDATLIPTVTGVDLRLRLRYATKDRPTGIALAGAAPAQFAEARLLSPKSRLHRSDADPAIWAVAFDPDQDLSVARGRQMILEATVYTNEAAQTVSLGTFTYAQPFQPDRVFYLSLAVATLFAALIFLIYSAPRAVFAAYSSVTLFIDELPSGGWSSLLRYVMKFFLLPFVGEHARVLDAWVVRNAPTVLARFEAEADLRKVSHYIELPIHSTAVRYERPQPSDFSPFFHSQRLILQITGPGGSGKTTFAFQLARWAALLSPERRLAPHRMLPVLIDEDASNLREVVRRKLTAWLGNDISPTFVAALLKKRRLLLLVDRISERSAETQTYYARLHGTEPYVNALVITTRHEIFFEAPDSYVLRPEPLDSSNVAHFILGLLRFYVTDGPSAEFFYRTDNQLAIAGHFGRLLHGSRTPDQPSPLITPLLVRLFLQQAVSLVDTGETLDRLPASVPEVYRRYLEAVNPGHILPHEEMLGVVEVLAVLSLGTGLVPTEFKASDAKVAVQPTSIERLVDNGVLLERRLAGEHFLRFALDPVAEFFAAACHAKRCGNAAEAWKLLLSQASAAKAEGFLLAIQLTWDAYHDQFGWPTVRDL